MSDLRSSLSRSDSHGSPVSPAGGEASGGDPDRYRDLRRDYGRASLSEAEVADLPLDQFEAWYAEAEAAGEPEPNAMTLATVGLDGRPSARIVLLRAADRRGFTFYTNYRSRKGCDIQSNPRAALLFFWPRLERQVRIEGTVELTESEESDAYFASRPRGSQLAAAASPQSEEVDDRNDLEARFRGEEAKWEGREMARPHWWGGYRVAPDRFEFWQGRPNRLHDRIVYLFDGDDWIRTRLAP
jgi:pyridoxamine 5'-phosphate oxidase